MDPVSASPTYTTLSGLLSFTNLPNSYIKAVLLCILPAVSMNTQSKSPFVASIIPYWAIEDGFFPYPYWNILHPNLSACVCNCSIAPDLKLSQPHTKHFKPACLNLYKSLAMVVVFPIPLMPTMVMTNGRVVFPCDLSWEWFIAEISKLLVSTCIILLIWS